MRKGIAEVMGAVILLAVTLVAGFAVFGYVRAEANVSELSYGQSVGATDSYLQERFVVPLVAYSSSSVTIYVYTNGQVASQLAQVEVYGPTRAAMDVVFNANQVTVINPAACAMQVKASSSNESPLLGSGTGSFSAAVNTVASVVLTLPACSGLSFQSGNNYFVSLLGQFGNTAVYSQGM